MNAFVNFLQQQRLMSVLRVVKQSNYFQLKLRNTTNAIEKLYMPNQYLFCMSHPLSLVLGASTQCLRNENENLALTNGMWTQNDHAWLGNNSHFDAYTLRTNCINHKKLASIVVEKSNQWLRERNWSKEMSEVIYRKRIDCIEHFLNHCSTARAEDFTFSFLPLHRIKMQQIPLKTAQMTYVELFRYLEEFGYGTLYITSDQSTLTFTMHDLSESKLFAVELPTSPFARYNKESGSFYPPLVRVDKWVYQEETSAQKAQFVRQTNCVMGNAFSTIEVGYADEDNILSGITTMALEKELNRDIESIKDWTQWVDIVFTKIQQLKKGVKEITRPFLRGRDAGASVLMTTNKTFLLTSKMSLTMTLDVEKQTTFSKTKLQNQAVYTPRDYTLYDVKLPDSPPTITVTNYTRTLDAGHYDIKKDVDTFRDTYTSYNPITVPRGFYTPMTCIRHLQHECDKYQYLSLIHI